MIKEGLYEDPERRDALFKITRFRLDHPPRAATARSPTMSALCARTRPRSTTSPATTPSASPPARSSRGSAPATSRCCCSPIPSTRSGFRARPGTTASRSSRCSQGVADIKAIPLKEGAPPPAETSAEVATLIAFFKQTLEGEIAEARASDRLTDSVACLVAPEFGPDRQLEKMLAAHGRLSERTKPALEVNASHPLTLALARRFADGQEKALIEDAAWLIYDEALLAEGETLHDAPAFAARLRRVMEKALG